MTNENYHIKQDQARVVRHLTVRALQRVQAVRRGFIPERNGDEPTGFTVRSWSCPSCQAYSSVMAAGGRGAQRRIAPVESKMSEAGCCADCYADFVRVDALARFYGLEKAPPEAVDVVAIVAHYTPHPDVEVPDMRDVPVVHWLEDDPDLPLLVAEMFGLYPQIRGDVFELVLDMIAEGDIPALTPHALARETLETWRWWHTHGDLRACGPVPRIGGLEMGGLC